jgi:hypothetical protein
LVLNIFPLSLVTPLFHKLGNRAPLTEPIWTNTLQLFSCSIHYYLHLIVWRLQPSKLQLRCGINPIDEPDVALRAIRHAESGDKLLIKVA